MKIRAVTVQGMEAPALLLHLAGFTKPLLLDTPNRKAVLGLTGSPVFDEWVGREVDLHVVGALGAQRIALFPLASPGAPPTPTPTRQPAIRSRLTTLLIVLLVVFLALAAAYWIERGGFIP